MAQNVLAVIKLQIPGGKATPAPPVGPALGQYGVPPGEAVRQLNEKTARFIPDFRVLEEGVISTPSSFESGVEAPACLRMVGITSKMDTRPFTLSPA